MFKRHIATAATLGIAGIIGAAGCSSSPSLPSWAAHLGSGVTVTAPQSSPAANSPGAVFLGFTQALAARNFAGLCGYYQPSVQSQCKSSLASLSSSKLPYAKNVSIGYVAIDGTKALIGSTGTYCSPGDTPECYTNTDPAAVFSSGKPFSQLWTAATASSSSSNNVYQLSAAEEINGKWYAFTGA
jgi:hypothetical protein